MLIQGICVEQCPDGFIEDIITGKCIIGTDDLKLVNTLFYEVTRFDGNSIGDFYTVEENFLHEKSLAPSVERGFYATERSSFVSKKEFLLAPSFSIMLYCQPFGNGILVDMPGVFSIEIKDGKLIAKLLRYQEFTKEVLETSIDIILNTWQRILFQVIQTSSKSLTLNLTLNSNSTSTLFSLSSSQHIKKSPLHIGDPNFLLTSKGFFYKIQLLNSINPLFYSDLNLPSCLFSQYIENSQCINCSFSCGSKFSCRHKNSCLLSYSQNCQNYYGLGDQDCISCSNGGSPPFCCSLHCKKCSKDKCEECEKGFSLSDGNCYNHEMFYNKPYRKNNECPEYCEICSENGCDQCIGNRHYEQNLCICNYGYSGNLCQTKILMLYMTISNDNIIFLQFNEDLFIGINEDDLVVLSQQRNIDFYVSTVNKSKYAIYVIGRKDIKLDEEVKIIVIREIVSISFLWLAEKNYTVVLKGLVSDEDKDKDDDGYYDFFYTCSNSFMMVFLWTTLIFAVICSNFQAFWAMLSYVQLMSFMYLISIPFPSRTKAVILGLRKYYMLPNFFSYFPMYDGYKHDYSRVSDLGMHTNSLVENIGGILSALFCFIVLFNVAKTLHWGISNYSKGNDKLVKALKMFTNSFKYNFYIRFTIQVYMELLVSGFLAIFSVSVSIVSQGYNLLVACAIVFHCALCIPSTWCLSCYEHKSQENSSNKKWRYSSLVYEFKENLGYFRPSIYSIFLLRKYFHVLLSFTLQSYPIVQLGLQESFSILVIFMQILFFILFVRPYKNPLLIITHALTEFLLCCIFPLLSLSYLDLQDSIKKTIDTTMAIILLGILAIHFLSGLSLFLKILKDRAQSSVQQKVTPEVSNPAQNNSQNRSTNYSISISPEVYTFTPQRTRTIVGEDESFNVSITEVHHEPIRVIF
ncbi:hypothetical protein SteCoe_25423 [Stentor coeruleus]|uniref:EGF-like domain-containing protein n=1 Tax=Stentor coeruleus TaxID=5963 RepID=A0A1R2BFF4_9CILI|nr:hypothetical protein SteCoe_25423 [Stentor coeruleus]